jgi:hypothetical protein
MVNQFDGELWVLEMRAQTTSRVIIGGGLRTWPFARFARVLDSLSDGFLSAPRVESRRP